MNLSNSDRVLIKKFLKKVPAFRNFSKENLEQIVDNFKIRHVRKNEAIFYQSDASTELYIILMGKVTVTLQGKGGEEFILTDLSKGDFFGELSLIDGKSRSATVAASEDSVFGVLRRESLLRAIKKEPDIAIALLETLVHRLRQATEREERFAFLDVHDRLLKLITCLVKTEGEKEIGGHYRIKKCSHRELASRIGASREAISKTLKELADKKVIIEEEKYFLVAPQLCERIDKTLLSTL